MRLEGEAMFEVAHDASQPFVVETYACDVEVCGTRFNVTADKDVQEFSAALFEGSVACSEQNERRGNSDGAQHHRPSEKRTSSFERSGNQDNYLWTDGIISFSGDDFGQIIDKLRKYFDVEIEVQREELPRSNTSG